MVFLDVLPLSRLLGAFFVNQSLSKAKGVHGIISLIVLADVFPGEDLVFEPPHRAWR